MNLDHLSNLTDDEFIKAVKAHPSYWDHTPTAQLLKNAVARMELKLYGQRGDTLLPPA